MTGILVNIDVKDLAAAERFLHTDLLTAGEGDRTQPVSAVRHEARIRVSRSVVPGA